MFYVAVMLPLWSSYLVKVYAWKLLLAKEGAVGWFMQAAGLSRALEAWLAAPIVGGPSLSVSYTGMVLTFLYLWTPFMVLPLQAALERVPATLIEASDDLGASPAQTFRRVIFPLAAPGLVAGSIFTFSLTLGDYIVPQIVGPSSLILGQAVYAEQGTAGNIPLAAAFCVAPILIMGRLSRPREAHGGPRCALAGTEPGHERQRSPLGLRLAAGAGLAFLHLPLAFILLYAFSSEDRSFEFPPPGLTLRWFGVAWGRPDIWEALALSIRVALVSTALALLLGTLAAAALARAAFFGREAVSLLFILPIALPGIVTGIALRSAFNLMDIPFSYWTIVLGHATFCIVVVYNNAVARFRRLSPSMVEASMDLGADGFQTFRHILLPSIGTALLAGRNARLRPVVRRGDRHHLHGRPAAHPADLDAVRADPAASAAGDQCRRRRRDRRHRAADPRRLLPDARGRARRRRREIAKRAGAAIRERSVPCSTPDMLIGENSSPAAKRVSGSSIRGRRSFCSTCRKPLLQQVDAAVNAAERAFATLVDDDACGAVRTAPEARRRDRAGRRGVCRSRSAQLRQTAHPGADRRDSGDHRLLPLLRRRGADDARRGGGRVRRWAHVDGPARSDRCRRLDRAVELSADDGGVEARARARRRQHRRPEALRADAAHHAEARAPDRRDLSRRASSMSSSGAERPSATR